MSGGSKLPVVLIVVALLLVGLYVWATVSGGFSGCIPSVETRASWQERWFKPKPIPRADLVLRGCSLVDGRIRFKGTCTIEVRGTEDKGSRSLRLTPDVNVKENEFRLDFGPRQGNHAPPHMRSNKLTKKAELNIPAEGALVELDNCGSKEECVVQVE